MTKKLYSSTFYGNEASDYAKENGYLDYATFAKAFDAVMNNDIISKTYDIGYWEQENGFLDNSEEEESQLEIFQYFIVSNNGAEIIKQYTNDPLFYNEELDMYVWGVTHCGTSWNYVLTDIMLNCGEEALEGVQNGDNKETYL